MRRHAGAPEHTAHPGRVKDDRDGQVSWLTGQRHVRAAFPDIRPDQGAFSPVANGARARRLQLRGQPRFRTRVPFSSPFPENLSHVHLRELGD
jgi:hypothetical protein